MRRASALVASLRQHTSVFFLLLDFKSRDSPLKSLPDRALMIGGCASELAKRTSGIGIPRKSISQCDGSRGLYCLMYRTSKSLSSSSLQLSLPGNSFLSSSISSSCRSASSFSFSLKTSSSLFTNLRGVFLTRPARILSDPGVPPLPMLVLVGGVSVRGVTLSRLRPIGLVSCGVCAGEGLLVDPEES